MCVASVRTVKFSEYRSGTAQKQFQYRSFLPTAVNHAWTWEEPDVHTLLAEANRRLGELNAFSLIVPDVDRFITMHVVKEAQTSSRIEGTQTSIEEAAETRAAGIDPERRDDWAEVRAYVAAMNEAMAKLRTLPLSTRLLWPLQGGRSHLGEPRIAAGTRESAVGMRTSSMRLAM